ncbi:MAG: DNA mismatch repair protein MutS [Synergistaceae bacterium]|nr:DNA mismatch repair protein MutS [Synergistaceae bacterium]
MAFELPDDVKITPWLSQYIEWKEKYPDCLLFFRMGDFYELFFDDAKILSAALNLTLTSRDANKSIPMAGVPHHALNVYLGRIMRLGYKVAICEQTSEPDGKSPQKLVDREVNRIITPGTYVPEESEDSGRLAAFSTSSAKGGAGKIAIALFSAETGKLEGGVFPIEEAVSLICAFAPLELLYPSGLNVERIPPALKSLRLIAQPNEVFKLSSASQKLKSLWGIQTLEIYGCSDDDPCVGCMWAVMSMLMSTQFGAVSHVTRFWILRSSSSLWIDPASQNSLELTGETNSLYSVLNNCVTPMGRRTLQSWILRPLTDVERIRFRQNAINSFVNDTETLSEVKGNLSGCYDIERAISRLLSNVGNERDIFSVKDTLNATPKVLLPLSNASFLNVYEIFSQIPSLSDLKSLLNSALSERGDKSVIRAGFDAELDKWREVSEKGELWLEEYAARERAASGISKLRIGRNNVFGYYLELSNAAASGAKIPEHFSRRQTMVNAERFVTDELKEFEEKAASALNKMAEITREIYEKLVGEIRANASALQQLGRALGELDCIASLSKVAWERNYVCPQINAGTNDIEIRRGRHPVLEAVSSDPFVPNDVLLSSGGARIVILTGPNMAGKSTWLRMTALLCIMSQMGSWIPASYAVLGITERLFTRIGARDDISRGNSTFMIEMLETANILNNVTDSSLVILDEVGRGTSTWDGMSIAWAVLEHLHRGTAASGCKVLFATHYHELTSLGILNGVTNLCTAVSENADGITFRHQVVSGAADKSYGIEVARLAGLPKTVLTRARELLRNFEKNRVIISNAPVQKSLFDEE